MASPTPSGRDELTRNALEAVIRIGLVVLLALWCFNIVRPFVVPVVWGIIIAVAVYPFYSRVRALLWKKAGFAAMLVTLAMLVVMVWPAILLGALLIQNLEALLGQLEHGSLTIPPPPHGIATWPVIGRPLAEFWNLASVNLDAALQQLEPQIKLIGKWLISAAAGAGLGVLQFVASVVIAGVLLAYSGGAYGFARDIGTRLAGEQGAGYVDLAEATVRSVARGVLGVALIQSLLAGLGFVVAGVPAAGLWAFLCLVLGVVQIGPGPILLPAVLYVFATGETVMAVLFLVWSIFVGAVDNVLKPMLLGRGVDVPMLVIFVGAIGGMLLSGIIGLFVGAVVLALGYKLFLAWLEPDRPATEAGAEIDQEPEGRHGS